MLFRKCRARQSNQRLGICKAFVLHADRAISTKERSELLRNILTKEERIPYDEKYRFWLKEQNLNAKVEGGKWIYSQLQNYYIFSLPSQTGWLSEHAFREYTENLPRRLDIVDSEYTITDMGRVLYSLMNEIDRQAFFAIERKHNPFLLSNDQKVFFLYNLLSADGDFLIPFLDTVLTHFGTEPFSYLEAGNLMPSLIDKMVELFLGMAYTASHRQEIEDLERLKSTIEKNIEDGSETKGSGSRREQECIPRLEWMVDLNILRKVASRTYAFTELGDTVVTGIAGKYQEYTTSGFADQAVQRYLDNDFFQHSARYFTGEKYDRLKIELPGYIIKGYEMLKETSGYCLFRPLLLLSNILSLSQQGPYLEYSTGVALLEETFQVNPEKLYFTTDRYGTDVQVKIYD